MLDGADLALDGTGDRASHWRLDPLTDGRIVSRDAAGIDASNAAPSVTM